MLRQILRINTHAYFCTSNQSNNFTISHRLPASVTLSVNTCDEKCHVFHRFTSIFPHQNRIIVHHYNKWQMPSLKIEIFQIGLELVIPGRSTFESSGIRTVSLRKMVPQFVHYNIIAARLAQKSNAGFFLQYVN